MKTPNNIERQCTCDDDVLIGSHIAVNHVNHVVIDACNIKSPHTVCMEGTPASVMTAGSTAHSIVNNVSKIVGIMSNDVVEAVQKAIDEKKIDLPEEELKEIVSAACAKAIEEAHIEVDLSPITKTLGDITDYPSNGTIFGSIGTDETGEDASLHTKADAIQSAIKNIHVPIPEGIAQESTPFVLEKALSVLGTDDHVPSDKTVYGEIGHDENDESLHQKADKIKEAISNIKVDVPSDVSRETEQYATENAAKAAKTAAEAAKAAAEGIVIPTDYAKEGTFTTWVNGLWSQFVSRIETAVAGLAKPSDIPSVAEVQDGLAKEHEYDSALANVSQQIGYAITEIDAL